MDKEVARCVQKLSRVTSRGGNFLLNIGPKPDGTVSAYQTEALQTIGKWVAAHRGSIFDVHTTPFQHTPWGAATWKDNELYLHVAKWPGNGKLRLPDLVSEIQSVHPYSDPSTQYNFTKLPHGGFEIELPKSAPTEFQTVLNVVCDDAIEASQRTVTQTDPNKIELNKDSQIARDFIHGMTYACKVKNVRNTWHFKPTEPGVYSAKLFVDVKAQKPRRNQAIDMSPRPLLVMIGDRTFHLEVPVTPGKAEIEIGQVELSVGKAQQAIVVTDLSKLDPSDSSPARFTLEPLWPERLILTKQ